MTARRPRGSLRSTWSGSDPGRPRWRWAAVGAAPSRRLAGSSARGANHYGELGDGTNTDRHAPVDVLGLSVPIADVEARGVATCALTQSGGVKCWGVNQEGALGDGTTAFSSPMPVDVVGLQSGVASISVGGTNGCAVSDAGGLKCWGGGGAGQLGIGTPIDYSSNSPANRNVPVEPIGLGSGVADVSVGSGSVCVLTTAGGVKCWGANYFGQLGDGTTTYRNVPTDVVGLGSGVTGISAGGDHTCAVMSNERVKCWGNNTYGQLGNLSGASSLVPIDVPSF